MTLLILTDSCSVLFVELIGVGVYLGWNLSTIGLIKDWAVDTKIFGISLNDINLKPLVSFSMVVGSRIIRGSVCVALSMDLLLSVLIPMWVVFINFDGFLLIWVPLLREEWLELIGSKSSLSNSSSRSKNDLGQL